MNSAYNNITLDSAIHYTFLKNKLNQLKYIHQLRSYYLLAAIEVKSWIKLKLRITHQRGCIYLRICGLIDCLGLLFAVLVSFLTISTILRGGSVHWLEVFGLARVRCILHRAGSRQQAPHGVGQQSDLEAECLDDGQCLPLCLFARCRLLSAGSDAR